MKTSIQLKQNTYNFNINKPLRISNTLKPKDNLTAWYVDQPKIEAVKGDGFIGDVSQGGSVNFSNDFIPFFPMQKIINIFFGRHNRN